MAPVSKRQINNSLIDRRVVGNRVKTKYANPTDLAASKLRLVPCYEEETGDLKYVQIIQKLDNHKATSIILDAADMFGLSWRLSKIPTNKDMSDD